MPSQFLLSVSSACRLRNFSYRTEKTYIYWIRRYIYFINKAHPATCGDQDVQAFLTYLAEKQHVSASTQKVALNALVNGKGKKNRQTLLAETLIEPLKMQMQKAKDLMAEDVSSRVGVAMEVGLSKKYPNARFEDPWAYIFPSSNWSKHPFKGEVCRYHLHPTVPTRALRVAVENENIFRPDTVRGDRTDVDL